MEMTPLNKNITIKKLFEGGNPPVHALWKFVFKVAEFGTLAQCLTLAISVMRYVSLHEVDKLFEIKFYQFEMKDTLISEYNNMPQGWGRGTKWHTGAMGHLNLGSFSDKLGLHNEGVFSFGDK